MPIYTESSRREASSITGERTALNCRHARAAFTVKERVFCDKRVLLHNWFDAQRDASGTHSWFI